MEGGLGIAIVGEDVGDAVGVVGTLQHPVALIVVAHARPRGRTAGAGVPAGGIDVAAGHTPGSYCNTALLGVITSG